jgi:hypothetical protein
LPLGPRFRGDDELAGPQVLTAASRLRGDKLPWGDEYANEKFWVLGIDAVARR